MGSDAKEDSTWIEQCLNGDLAAFDKLTIKYQDRVYNVALRLSKDREEALDIAQETFLKAYRNLAAFQRSAGFYTWIYRIAVNTALSRRRYHSARPKPVRLRGESEGARVSAPADEREADPARQADRAETIQRVEACIEALEAGHRAVIVLRDIEGRNYDEIAEILDCPRGTVKSRLHRARKALRKELKRALPDAFDT